MPELKLYSAAQLRDWLEHNACYDGLTEHVIAPARAWAFVHNPYVKDEDHLVAAIYERERLAAFTAAFPEMLDDRRMWWFSTLWCHPDCQGKGYGLIAIGSLAEEYGVDNCLDRWAAQETVEIFEYLGHHTAYSERFLMGDKSIHPTSIKNRMLLGWQALLKNFHRRSLKVNLPSDISLNYISRIDDETFAFIQAHRNGDCILHSREMMDWEFRYPVLVSSPLADSANKDNVFSSVVPLSQYYMVQVMKNDELVGFYWLKGGEKSLGVVYLYYDSNSEIAVFKSILAHAIRLKVDSFQTENKKLADYIRNEYYFPKVRTERVSFSFPKSNDLMQKGLSSFQMGDGDSFI